jgi:hypothetical protein
MVKFLKLFLPLGIFFEEKSWANDWFKEEFHISCGKETPRSSASGKNCRPFSKLLPKEGFFSVSIESSYYEDL